MIRRALGVNSSQFACPIVYSDRTKCGESAMAPATVSFSWVEGEGTGTDPPKPAAVRSRPVLRSKLGVRNRERSRRMVKLQNWVIALLRRLEEEARAAEANPGDLVLHIATRKCDSGNEIRWPILQAFASVKRRAASGRFHS